MKFWRTTFFKISTTFLKISTVFFEKSRAKFSHLAIEEKNNLHNTKKKAVATTLTATNSCHLFNARKLKTT